MIRMTELRAAIKKVEREIRKVGLWQPGMEDTQVYLTPLHLWYGWTCTRSGDIFIPRISFSHCFDSVEWNLLDILRHEYGHVLEWHVPEVLRGWPRGKDRVSAYATHNRSEDFAETFKYFLQYKGNCPAAWRSRKGIFARWEHLKTVAIISKVR